MHDSMYKILENTQLTHSTYKMRLQGDTSHITNSGQFVNIVIQGLYLRRPISVCDYNDNEFTIIYKVVGKGTVALAQMGVFSPHLQIMTGLGNGFDTSKSGELPLLIGGGVGIPPLYNLAKTLIEEGKKPIIIVGFQTKDEAFYINEFKELGVPFLVATNDGSLGTKGFVTDIIKEQKNYTYFYTCGPHGMLKAIYDETNTTGQLSFEERMGCGFGACMGCSCETKYGYKRICREGPVLEKEEIIW